MQRDLVIRAQGGDHDAFSALATEVIGGLHATARLILRDVELADDAVQDALIAAWLDIRGVHDADRFEAWLHRLLVRACYKVAGRARRRPGHRGRAAPTLARAPDGGGLLALRDQLERGFRRLSPEQRAVLVLHHYLGLTDGDAADALDIPIGTLKSRLNRATQALRASMDADERRVGLPWRSPA